MKASGTGPPPGHDGLMAIVLVTGGTGTLGRHLVPALIGAGHEVRVLSRQRHPGNSTRAHPFQGDLRTGAGLNEAVQGAHTVVHCASEPRRETVATDVDGTGRLVASSRRAGIQHIVYVSIVGVDRNPLPYYWAKLAAEVTISAGGVPWTIQRATQFHDLVALLLRGLVRLPVLPLPTSVRLQPVDPAEVADRLVALVGSGPQGRAPDFGGPQVRSVRDLAATYLVTRGLGRPVLSLPFPGRAGKAFRAGAQLCPDQALGAVTWERWLGDHPG